MRSSAANYLVAFFLPGLFVCIGSGGESAQKPAAPTKEGVEFFERYIRPVLVERCYECHSTQAPKVKGKLLLDSQPGIAKGGASGPVLVPGDVEKSPLIQAIRWTDADFAMPPKGKLSPQQIEKFEQWVKMGAPDPRTKPTSGSPKTTTALDLDAGRKWWAFRPVTQTATPLAKQSAWVKKKIDFFVLQELEAKQLAPSPAADPRTLIQRVYLDLIGLRPSYEQTEAFAKDPSDQAFAQIVDQLLASPQYGQRWGRYWLDVARYGEDNPTSEATNRPYPFAWRYRDWVIDAVNRDVPYNQFVTLQLAADLMPKTPRSDLAATGFLGAGPIYHKDGRLSKDVIENLYMDDWDERVDVVSRGVLGLTVACARCHDHKYDAIAQADYYGLYGVFASSEEPVDLPLLDRSAAGPGAREFRKKFAAKEHAFQEHVDKQFHEQTETARRRVGDYLLAVATTRPDPNEDAVFFMSLSPNQLRPQIVGRWRRYVARRSTSADPVFGPWGDFMRLSDEDFVSKAPAVTQRWLGFSRGTAPGQLNPLVAEALATADVHAKADVAKLYGDAFLKAYAAFKHDPPKDGAADDTARRQLLEVLTGSEGPAWFPRSNAYLYMSRVERDHYHHLQLELDLVAVKSRIVPPRAMVVNDAANLCSPRIFVRGNAAQPGEYVPRQFLRVLAGDHQRPFTHGSGRLDLARAIASRDNPLTARVFVNRVWMHHFGEPLVQSPSDFGVRAVPPTNPELLDYLAWTFMADNWSIKNLHRQIVLSAAYQQASADRPAYRRIDPENRLLWRFNRQRLDMEAMRDSMLAVSGRLDPTLFGRAVDIVGDPLCNRRTIYGLVDRQHLPGFHRAFDFANPDQSAERRPLTTVPQQALFAMNSPFMLEQARSLAGRPQVAGKLSPGDRVESLYQIVLARRADEAETELALRFVAAAEADASRAGDPKAKLDPWAQYAQVLLASNEFLYVD
jgi:Protein of unknown function (DUF1553)/Protein of unknown function (DUF1549)/Planctomycete cytochrome C